MQKKVLLTGIYEQFMQKSLIFLLIVGSLIVAGVVLSYYGSLLITEELAVKEELIPAGNSIEISLELSSSESQMAVFVVQILNFDGQNLVAKVFDPYENQIVSKTIDMETVEERFEILEDGTHRLEIENLSNNDALVVGVIGHMPDNSELSVGITGFYILVVGLVGIVGVGIYAIKNRKKEKVS